MPIQAWQLVSSVPSALSQLPCLVPAKAVQVPAVALRTNPGWQVVQKERSLQDLQLLAAVQAVQVADVFAAALPVPTAHCVTVLVAAVYDQPAAAAVQSTVPAAGVALAVHVAHPEPQLTRAVEAATPSLAHPSFATEQFA